MTRKPSDNAMISDEVLLKTLARDEVMSSNEETAMLSVGEHVVIQK